MYLTSHLGGTPDAKMREINIFHTVHAQYFCISLPVKKGSRPERYLEAVWEELAGRCYNNQKTGKYRESLKRDEC